MLAKSKVSIINKDSPTKIIQVKILEQADMFGMQKCRIEYQKVDNFIVKAGDTVGILGYHLYSYKAGGLYTLITIKNETLFLDENSLIVNGIFKEKNLIFYKNRTPSFDECMEIEEFNLDLL